jgi:hypothetical protein
VAWLINRSGGHEIRHQLELHIHHAMGMAGNGRA